jgi:hypothetical protein
VMERAGIEQPLTVAARARTPVVLAAEGFCAAEVRNSHTLMKTAARSSIVGEESWSTAVNLSETSAYEAHPRSGLLANLCDGHALDDFHAQLAVLFCVSDTRVQRRVTGCCRRDLIEVEGVAGSRDRVVALDSSVNARIQVMKRRRLARWTPN